ncbi:MAG: SBBP repeat-containing protein, partial [Bacteroidales bacterium]|nr:SBBP repeat-containing protein [Bacteroidales bacterium]
MVFNMKNQLYISWICIIFFFSSNGLLLSQNWIKSTVINGSNIEPRYSIIDNQNNTVLIAVFRDTIYSPYNKISYGARDLFLMKLNQTGQVLWYNHIGNSSVDYPGGITVDNNNNIYITSSFQNVVKFSPTDSLVNNNDLDDIFLAKYSPYGTLHWANIIGTGNNLQNTVDLKFDGSSILLVTGYFKDSLIIGSTIFNRDTIIGNSYYSNFIGAFNLDGNYLWSNEILGNNNFSRFISLDFSQNGYYFGGYFIGSLYFDIDTINSYSPSAFDAFIYKTDFNGNGQWVRRIRGSGTENF